LPEGWRSQKIGREWKLFQDAPPPSKIRCKDLSTLYAVLGDMHLQMSSQAQKLLRVRIAMKVDGSSDVEVET
jgi:hypothetical protein